MSLNNSSSHYGLLSVFLHWSMALVIYAMFALGLWMVGLSYYDTWYHNAPEIHKSIGVMLMLALIIRLLWRVISPPPKPLSSYSAAVRISAVVAHWLLYSLLIAILFSGYLISTADGKPISVFGWFSLPALLTGAGEPGRFSGRYSFMAGMEHCDPFRLTWPGRVKTPLYRSRYHPEKDAGSAHPINL